MHGATWPVSVLMIVFALLTMISVLYAKETAPSVRQRLTGATERLTGVTEPAASASKRAA